MTTPTNRGASVRLLPPLVFLAPLLVGLVLGRMAPWRLPSSGAWPTALTVAGLLLLVAGVAVMAWAAVVLWRHETTVIPWGRVDHLVTEGPFRHTRNPIYLGDLLVYVGVALVAGTWWPIVLLPVPLLVMERFVIAREEAYLGDRFGEAYAAYCARVRRWV